MSANRRTALVMTGAGLAAALTGVVAYAATPQVVLPSAGGADLKTLIATHRCASRHLNAICPETDSVALGHEPSKAAWRRWRVAVNSEYQAMAKVCCHRPRTAAEARMKANYLLRYERGGGFDMDLFRMVLKSLSMVEG